MDYVTARSEDARRIYELVRATIHAIYPKYYPNAAMEKTYALHPAEDVVH